MSRPRPLRRDTQRPFTALAPLTLALLLATACGGIAIQREGEDNANATGGHGADGAGVGGQPTGGTSSGGAPSTGGLPSSGGTFAAGGTSPSGGQSNDFIGIDWALQFGTPQDDWPYAVGVDASGDVYVAGDTQGALRGQPSIGLADAFLRKYDANGVELWTRQFGSSQTDSAHALAVDPIGNVIVAGITLATLPGQSSAGGADVFLRKYDAAGKEVWTRQFGTDKSEDARAVCVYSANEIYVAGIVRGVLPFQLTYGDADAFLRKYDLDGNELWTRQFGTSGWDIANACTVAPSGDVYVTGNFRALTAEPPGKVAFLGKYDSAGNELWTQELGGSAVDASALWSTDDGVVRVGGHNSAGAAGSWDALLLGYYPDSTFFWDYGFGTNGDEEINSASFWTMGNAFVAGRTNGPLGFPSAGGFDVFVRKYDPLDATTTWQFGTPEDETTMSVAANPEGGAYVVGYTRGTFPGQTNLGLTDAFLVKLP